jgi:transposase
MQPANTTFIGIDWADKKHDFHLVDPDGKIQFGVFEQTPKAIADVVEAWRKAAPDANIVVAIEATKGALINALLEFEDITIYPINPAAMASYRKAFAHGGGKNDVVDAKLLAQYLIHYIDQLKPLEQDQPLTREIAAMSEDRRRLVDQRADLANELTAVLKTYFPAILLLKAAKPYAAFVLTLLLKYPSLELIQKAGGHKLRKLFLALGLKKTTSEDRIETLVSAIPLTTNSTTIAVASRRVLDLCEQLRLLNKLIKRLDDSLEGLVSKHADYKVASSFPHAATATQARLIASFGDDRTRYPTASSMSTYSGIAPVTIQSGRMNVVRSRWACPKFMRQTFHEYAGQSINGSGWAKAYYDIQISRGKSKQTARRALAYKWQRIMHKCWASGTPYSEDRYVERLRATGSPIIAMLDKSIEVAA